VVKSQFTSSWKCDQTTDAALDQAVKFTLQRADRLFTNTVGYFHEQKLRQVKESVISRK
jgi:hypothetical protein